MVGIREFTLDELLNPQTPLAKHYHNKLPLRGWAGKLTPTEKEFVKLTKEVRRKLTIIGGASVPQI